jgi:hypothetical protein
MARKGTGPKPPEAGKTEKPTEGATGSEEVVVEVEVSEEETPEVAEEEVIEEEPAEDEVPAKKDKVIPAGKGPNKPKKRMFEIMIAENDGPDGGDVFVTDPSDGTPFLIQRGQKVRVPVGVVNNLRESVTGKLSYDDEGNEVWKDISRFAMTVYGEVK